MNATLQLEFPLKLPVERPLVPISVAMVLGDRNEDYVLASIDTGAIRWAWDIRGAAADAREIRMWGQSLIAWFKSGCGALAGLACEMTEQEVLAALFPHSREEIKGTELQRMFSCGHSHIINLIDDGLITATSKPGPGPLGSPKITRSSIIQLLLDRRVL